MIQLFTEETQIKEIAQILLNRENIKISYGSCWNIIESWRSSQSKSTEPVVESNQIEQPLPYALVQKSPSANDSKLSGCPLSRFIPKEIPEVNNLHNKVNNSDLEGPGKDTTSEVINQPTATVNVGEKIVAQPEEDIDILDKGFEPDMDGYDPAYDEDPDNLLLPKSDSEPEEQPQVIVRSRGSKQLQSFKEIERQQDSLYLSTLMKQIEQEKALRRNEWAKIEQRQRYLEIAKQEIDEARNDLDLREAKLLPFEASLPIARQLQELSLTFEDILLCFSYIEMIKEKAATENVDLKTAIHHVAQDLSSYRQLGGMEKTLEQKKGELQMLTIFITMLSLT